MRLNSFPISSPAQIQADWVELKCLADFYDCLPIADIRSAIELQNDTQDDDIGREDGINEAIIDSILNEISSREDSLQESYPFQIEDGGAVLSLKHPFAEATLEQKVYIYCLIFSHVSNSPILSTSSSILPADRDIMQICSTIAAAGYVRGHSISFGFPRPDRSNFYTKAGQVLGLLGDGELHTINDVNPVHALFPKDGGIDVISWQQTRDNRPGTLLFFSQVASGANWREKPVLPYINIFQEYWLKHRIRSRINDAIFIPFDMVDDEDNRYTASQLLESHLSNLGTIFYRRRIPAYFKEGIEFAQGNANCTVERINESHKISDYVDLKVGALKSFAA